MIHIKVDGNGVQLSNTGNKTAHVAVFEQTHNLGAGKSVTTKFK